MEVSSAKASRTMLWRRRTKKTTRFLVKSQWKPMYISPSKPLWYLRVLKPKSLNSAIRDALPPI